MSTQIKEKSVVYRIGAAARIMGLSADNPRLRAQRYRAQTPARTKGGDRNHASNDVSRLKSMNWSGDSAGGIGAIAVPDTVIEVDNIKGYQSGPGLIESSKDEYDNERSRRGECLRGAITVRCLQRGVGQAFALHRLLFAVCILMCATITGVTAEVSARELIIDDRSSGNLNSTLGPEWRLFTDTVMGGESTGDISLHNHRGKDCLRMRGDVSTENNGGFVQIALPLSAEAVFDASSYTGIELTIAGNNERYNLHLRTAGLWFPWQSYRADFLAQTDWRTVRVPFTAFKAYKTKRSFDAGELKRIGLVAIGRDFHAELCLASIRFYTE